MKQGAKSSSTSTSSTYTRDIRNIEHDVNAGIAHTRELNAGKEELWAKFDKKTEVTVVTRLESLSSTDIGELSKWFREKAKPQITILSISNSDIDDKAAIALAKVIKPQSNLNKLTTLQIGHKLSKLTTLELVDNKISDEGFETLAKGIQTNTTITTLELDLKVNTNIDEGIITLANAVSTNRTITTLKICVGKKISDQAVDAIAHMVRTNETIKTLELSGTHFYLLIDKKNLINDARWANPNSKIESLRFNGNPFDGNQF